MQSNDLDNNNNSPSFLRRQQIVPHVSKSVTYTPWDVAWVPYTATLTVVGQHANGNGLLAFYSLLHGELNLRFERRLPHPVRALTYRHTLREEDGKESVYHGMATTVAVGDFAGGLRVYDVERLAALSSSSSNNNNNYASSYTVVDAEEGAVFTAPRAHDTIINALDGARCSGPPELISGSRDGAVRVWDCRQPSRAIVSLNPSSGRDCWAVTLGNSYDPDERVLASGYDNGDVKLFDLRMNRMLHEMNVGNGVCHLEFDRADIPMNKLYISMLEGRVRCVDLRTCHPELGYAYVEERVSEGTVWRTRALPQNREVFISGGGGELLLQRYQYPPERERKDAEGRPMGVAGAVERINTAKVSDQPIHALDWNRGKEGLLACASLDQTVRVMLVTRLGLLR